MAITSTAYTPPLVPAELVEGDSIQAGDPRFGIIWANPQRVSGAACFFGSRVPVQTLFDYIEAGDTIDDFVDGFPPITREHVLAVLELAKADLLHGSIGP
jgi:uncharacterized protein (DUF433 family)